MRFGWGFLLLVSGCFLDSTGAPVGGGGDGAGGSPATGGEGGVFTGCTQDSDCPPSEPCLEHDCQVGRCEQVFFPRGTACDDDGAKVCDGRGACLLDLGQTCAVGDACESGFCTDDVCCESACEASCASCAEGACLAVPAGMDPDTECGGGVCDGAFGCATGAVEAAWSLGSSNLVEAWVLAAGDGQITAGGLFRGQMTPDGAPFDAVNQDAWVIRWSDDGGVDFATWVTGAGDEDVTGAARGPSGSTYVVGRFTSDLVIGGTTHVSAGGPDAFVARLDAGGARVFSVPFGDNQEQVATGVAADSNGVVVVGSFRGTIDLGGGIPPVTSAGDLDVFVAKFDEGGAPLFVQRFGGSVEDRARDVAIRADGSIVVTGITRGAIAFGSDTVTAQSGEGAWVAVLDAAGDPQFADIVEGPEDQSSFAVAVAPDGGFAITGTMRGSATFNGAPLTSAGNGDVFVAVWNADHTHRWARRFGNPAEQRGFGVAFDPSGNLLLSGAARGAIDFGGGPLTGGGDFDVFVAKLSGGGTHLWSFRYGDGQDQHGTAIAAAPDGDVWLAGFFLGTLDIGGTMLVNQGGSDAFVVNLAP